MNYEIPSNQQELIAHLGARSAPGVQTALRAIALTVFDKPDSIANQNQIIDAMNLVYDRNTASLAIPTELPLRENTSTRETTQLRPQEAFRLYLSPFPRLRRLTREQQAAFPTQARIFAQLIPPEDRLEQFREAGYTDQWIAVPSEYPLPYTQPIIQPLWDLVSQGFNQLEGWTFYHNLIHAHPLPEHNAIYTIRDVQETMYIHIRRLERPIIGIPEDLQDNLGEWSEVSGVSDRGIDPQIEKIQIRDSRQMERVIEDLGLRHNGLISHTWDYSQPHDVRGIVLLTDNP
jgi:hypothetical protein